MRQGHGTGGEERLSMIAEGSRFFSADRPGLRVATGTVDAADW